MKKFITNSVTLEGDLNFEFGLCAPQDPDTQADLREAIADVVKRAEAGETEIDSPYLNVTVIID